ncbi:MAG: hypothetical protein ACK56L_08480 [Pseudanabaena sp.]|jgi:hypothetical protein
MTLGLAILTDLFPKMVDLHHLNNHILIDVNDFLATPEKIIILALRPETRSRQAFWRFLKKLLH